MTNKPAERKTVSADELRRVFETAVEEIQQPEKPAPRVTYGLPIAPRRGPAATQPGGENRALSDAARALAELWKVPATSR